LVLVVNDQEWCARSLASILDPQGYAVLRAHTGRKGLERVRTASVDLILMNALLPDIDAVELCGLLRAEPSVTRDTAIVITAASHATRERRLEAMRAGAWDYLVHPLDAEVLIARFESFVAAKAEADRARELSLTDAATGFYNVQGLGRRARELAAQAFRQHSALACVVLTVDLPPSASEDARRVATSQALERVANVLRRTGRVSDAVGRVGENELAVFAPETDAKGAELFANRLQDALRSDVRLRVGYDAVRDYREASIEPLDLLARASTALDRSKQDSISWIHPF
jgi:diguanylate cyclase (GGDEF)-like protein